MAQQDKTKELEVREEIEDEDELDGWGPVRVRRSTIPSAPPGHGGLHTSDAQSDDCSGDSQNKTIMT
jgi:hypothetical protein